jgi:hypothetical protein
MVSRTRGSAFTALVVGVALVACIQDEGIVELNWAFVDRNQEPVYPGETLTSCSFSGRLAAGEDAREYGLHVELRVCDATCEAGCASSTCLVHEQRFSCQTARGTARVPAVAGNQYTFTTRVVAISDGEGEDSACYCTIRDECALVPGSRTREVRPGLVTDLQVYQLVLPTLDVQNNKDTPIALDLAECCEPSPGCA